MSLYKYLCKGLEKPLDVWQPFKVVRKMLIYSPNFKMGVRSFGSNRQRYMASRERKEERGFILAELTMYITVALLVMSFVIITSQQLSLERHVFDTSARTFYMSLKRLQTAALQGSIYPYGDERIYVESDRYEHINYGPYERRAYQILPEGIHLTVLGHKTNYIVFDDKRGTSDLFRCRLTDDKLGIYREYVFSQQTGHIRWWQYDKNGLQESTE